MKTQLTEFERFKWPVTQAECDQANTLRDYERAHKVWMNLSVFTDAGKRAKYEMDCARDAYLKAVKANHPDWIVF